MRSAFPGQPSACEAQQVLAARVGEDAAATEHVSLAVFCTPSPCALSGPAPWVTAVSGTPVLCSTSFGGFFRVQSETLWLSFMLPASSLLSHQVPPFLPCEISLPEPIGAASPWRMIFLPIPGRNVLFKLFSLRVQLAGIPSRTPFAPLPRPCRPARAAPRPAGPRRQTGPAGSAGPRPGQPARPEQVPPCGPRVLCTPPTSATLLPAARVHPPSLALRCPPRPRRAVAAVPRSVPAAPSGAARCQAPAAFACTPARSSCAGRRFCGAGEARGGARGVPCAAYTSSSRKV